MTVSTTTRLVVQRWTEGTDPLRRVQMDATMANIEANAAKFGQRLAGGDPARPTPSAATVGQVFYDKVNNTIAYSDGTEWITIVSTLSLGSDLTFANDTDIVLGTGNGTKIGTANNQKLGFFNAAPVVQQANSIHNRTALQALGLIASGGQTFGDVRVIPSATARPASGTHTGEVIFEERTISLLVWTGAAWVGLPPCGTIQATLKSTADPGWIMCDGGGISTTYTELRAILGTTTPDLRNMTLKGRATLGAGSATGGNDAIPASVLFAFTPDTTTSAPGGSDVSAKALNSGGSTDNNGAYATVNWQAKL